MNIYSEKIIIIFTQCTASGNKSHWRFQRKAVDVSVKLFSTTPDEVINFIEENQWKQR